MGTIAAEVVDTGEKRDGRGRRVLPPGQRMELIEAYRGSGLTMAAFARREALNYTTFAGWMAKAGKGGNPKNTIRFAEVRLGTPRSTQRIFRINAFMTVCLGTALFLAAATGQQRRLEREQARLIDDLRAASNRAKRLEEAVTICAWTGRVMWQDRWVSVEMFLRERYLVNINHGISEEALDAMLKELRTGQAGDVGQKGAEMDPGTERTGGS
jgi:hypothetical protein